MSACFIGFPLLSPLGKVAAKPPIEVYLKLRLMLRLPLVSFCYRKKKQKWESFPYVKVSHRGEAPPRGGGEGRILFSIRIFSIKWRNLFALPLLSPSGLTLPNCRFKAISASRVARSAERGLFKISPYVAASPCLKKFSKLHFSAKIVRLQSLPLGGKVDKAKLWTNEGRNLFSIRIFSIKFRNLFALPFLSPSGKVAAKPPIEVCLKFRLMLRPSLAFPFGESGAQSR